MALRGSKGSVYLAHQHIMKYKIVSIFPTPLLTATLGRDFSNKEVNFIESKINDSVLNRGNETSLDNYVIDNLELKGLKSDLEFLLKSYLKDVVNPLNEFDMCITQSWLNTTTEGGWHHIHRHPNSYLSGVVYIRADKDSDNIVFSKQEYKQIDIKSKTRNKFNTDSKIFSVGTGNVIIFPSKLWHQVETKLSSSIRVSLAFNVMPKGIFGDKERLTEWVNE